MARVCTLFSGSSGNATYIGSSGCGVLVDAGVSAKALFAALSEQDIDPESIKALLITHEHRDHMSGLHAVAAKLGIPVFASRETLTALDNMGVLNKLEIHETNGENITVDDMSISRFCTPHDCEGSSGYTVCTPDGRMVGVATDIGCLTDEIRGNLLGCDLVVLESNHDVMMLQNGPYPYRLKRRILSDCGHLSNACCSDFLPSLIESGTTRIVLAHLSRENNLPAIAQETARSVLISSGMKENSDYILQVAPPQGGKLIVL